MPLESEHVLSAAAVEALDSLFSTSETHVEVTDRDMLNLILQNLTEEEREHVAEGLVHSSRARTRLVELAKEAQRLHDLPLDQWPKEGKYRAIYELAIENLLVQTNRLRDWTTETRSLLASIGRNAKTLLSAPRFASARGAADDGPRIFATVSESGTLRVVVNFEDPDDGPFKLEMVDPLGGSLPIATGVVADGILEFNVEGFGDLTGLPEGSLPGSMFRIESGAKKTAPEGKYKLWVEGEGGELVSLDLMRTPYVAAEILNMELVVPTGIAKAYRSHRLVLLLPLGSQEVKLCSLAVSELLPGEVLQVHVWGVPDGTVPYGSVFRARFEQVKDL